MSTARGRSRLILSKNKPIRTVSQCHRLESLQRFTGVQLITASAYRYIGRYLRSNVGNRWHFKTRHVISGRTGHMQSFPGALKMQDLKMSTKETAGLGLCTITCTRNKDSQNAGPENGGQFQQTSNEITVFGKWRTTFRVPCESEKFHVRVGGRKGVGADKVTNLLMWRPSDHGLYCELLSVDQV